ncbi:PTS system nitrogen regulatory IIA component [Oxalobacteraceae bacterium GrIS 2.11]
MNSVAALFSPNEVLLDLEAADKQALFKAIGHLWEEHRGLTVLDVAGNLHARETLGSTGLGHGVAIPHARIHGLVKAVATFVRPARSIEFDAPDGRPVACCFVLLVPAQVTEQHLQILAEVAAMLSNVQFREKIGTSNSQVEIHRLFSTWRDPFVTDKSATQN